MQTIGARARINAYCQYEWHFKALSENSECNVITELPAFKKGTAITKDYSEVKGLRTQILELDIPSF